MRSLGTRHLAICLRDRDRIFGDNFTGQVQDMGIEEVLSAPRSPWQRAYIERIIGTIRRECLDHVIIFSEAALYRQVKSFAEYYHRSRTHLSLSKDSPESRVCAAARTRTNCGDSASRRPSPPLRPARSLKTMESSDCPRKRCARRFPAFHHCH